LHIVLLQFLVNMKFPWKQITHTGEERNWIMFELHFVISMELFMLNIWVFRETVI
jgi:hypothetical protein